MSRDYSKVLPQFWTGETGRWIREQGSDCIVAALYLMTCPSANMIGLYYLPLPTMCHETGMSIQGASKALARLSEGGFAVFDTGREEVWVPQMARIQVGDSLKPGDKQIKGIERLALTMRKSRFFARFVDLYSAPYHLSRELVDVAKASPFQAPSKALRSQEQDQEQEQDQDLPSGDPAGAGPPVPQQRALGLAIQEPPRPKKATAPEVAEAITHFQRRWVDLRRPADGKRPTMTDADRGQLVRLIGEHGLEATKGYVERFLSDEDSFLAKEGYALKHLPSRLDGYRTKPAETKRGNTAPGTFTRGGDLTDEYT